MYIQFQDIIIVSKYLSLWNIEMSVCNFLNIIQPHESASNRQYRFGLINLWIAGVRFDKKKTHVYGERS